MYENRHLTGNALEAYKKTLKLSDEQKDVIVGTLLGDSTMGLREGKPLYSLKFEQKPENESYINHLYEIMYPYVGSSPEKRIDPNTNFVCSEVKSVWFRTYRHHAFKFYFDLFYKVESTNNGIKKKCQSCSSEC